MNRRHFLRVSSAAALAFASAPAWLRRAFADSSCPADADPERLVSLASAYRRAQQTGRRLLVLVIPEQAMLGWDRGAAFGELLNHGSDEQLAPLASVEVVCAHIRDLRRLVP